MSQPLRYNRYGYPSRENGTAQAKEAVLYGSLGLGTAAGLFFLVRYIVKKGRANLAERHSAEAGNPALFAKQFKMAFDNDNSMGWGTDEDVVFSTLTSIPSRSVYTKVQKAYTAMYNRSLNADLEEELDNDEYARFVQILNTKP